MAISRNFFCWLVPLKRHHLFLVIFLICELSINFILASSAICFFIYFCYIHTHEIIDHNYKNRRGGGGGDRFAFISLAR